MFVCVLLCTDVGMLVAEQPLNFANDLNYNIGMTCEAYSRVESQMGENVGAFVSEIEGGLVSGAMVLILRDVRAGEEIGIGYGYDFWSKHADMGRYVASLHAWELCELKSMLASHF